MIRKVLIVLGICFVLAIIACIVNYLVLVIWFVLAIIACIVNYFYWEWRDRKKRNGR